MMGAMKPFPLSVLVFGFCGLCPWVFAQQLSSTSLPNILLIVSDDQGYGDLGIHGNTVIETPVLDQLFTEGIELERFYVSPVCAPTRASLLTGRYHHRTGVCGVFQGEEILRGEETTLAELLKEAGYATGCFGKWHNGNHWPETPNAQGFDTFVGFTAGVIYNYYDPELLHNNRPVVEKGYITDILTDNAIAFMQKAHAGRKPFFCYVPYNVPHTPIQADRALYGKYQKSGLNDFDAGVYAMLENMDGNIGRLLKTLKDLEIESDTVVIFFSDNGPNSLRFNGGLKGKKSSVFEGGVRSPFVIRWPGTLRGERKISTPTAHVDLLPTIAELTGIEVPREIELDGVDLSPLFEDREFLFGDRLIYTFPFTRPNDKGIPLPGSVRNRKWAAVKFWEQGWTLYNLEEDPAQAENLAISYPGILHQLRTQYERKFSEVTRRGMEVEPIQIGHPEEPVSVLKAGNAFLETGEEGGIAFTYTKFPLPGNWITAWTDAGAHAYWKMRNTNAGRYRILLKYALGPAGVGTRVLVVGPADKVEGSLDRAFVPEEQAIPHLLENEKKKYRIQSWATADLGEMNLPAGDFELFLKVSGPFVPDTLEVKALELIRLGDASGQ